MKAYVIRSQSGLYAIAATEDETGQHLVFGDKEDAIPFSFSDDDASLIQNRTGLILEEITPEDSKARALALLKKLQKRLR